MAMERFIKHEADPLRRLKQKDCPICIDITYKDGDDKEHIMFDICPTHMRIGLEQHEQDRKDQEKLDRMRKKEGEGNG